MKKLLLISLILLLISSVVSCSPSYTQEDLDAAYKAGHADGYDAGAHDGYKVGYEVGYDRGYKVGYEEAEVKGKGP